MKYDTLSYSLKVWITSVLVAAILFQIPPLFKHISTFADILKSLSGYLIMCVFTAFFGFIFSFVTWIIFGLCILIIANLTPKPKLRSWLIFFIGILLATGTFVLIFSPFGVFDELSEYHNDIYLIPCTWVSIGLSIWYHNLNPSNP
jgi:hypothetical protein